MSNVMCTSLGATEDDVRNEVRMTVDFTVLPLLMPEEPTLSDKPSDTQTATEPVQQPAATPAPPLPTTSEAKPDPAPAPAPEPAAESQPAPAPTGTRSVKAISLEETPLGFTITAVTEGSVNDTSYINLDDPRRLVIDLHGSWRLLGKNVIRSEGMVKHIVIGEHPDRLRMVIHFRTPPAKNVEPQFKLAENELYIMVPKQ